MTLPGASNNPEQGYSPLGALAATETPGGAEVLPAGDGPGWKGVAWLSEERLAKSEQSQGNLSTRVGESVPGFKSAP